jgi:2'-5' RNA ligase
MATERLFLSIALPEAVRSALAALAEPAAGLHWLRPAQLHLTLRFLGDVPEELIEPLGARLATVRIAPFILPIAGVGSFPPRAPARVLCIGTGPGHPRLFQLRQRVDDAVLAAGLRPDLRTFHPHVTLARVEAPAADAAERWLRRRRDAAAPPFRVDAFSLCASELRPDGAVHTLKRRFPLEN